MSQLWTFMVLISIYVVSARIGAPCFLVSNLLSAPSRVGGIAGTAGTCTALTKLGHTLDRTLNHDQSNLLCCLSVQWPFSHSFHCPAF
ncbi:hypothetical protein DFH06DRAFT_1161230 [Mycena polygramma]|nr:hypothetical protein DFH06DRAFT_1161230 [Mycena polygramma]